MKSDCLIEAVFFDLDGTLLDTAPDLWAACNAALKAYQRPPVSLAEFRRWVSGGAAKIIWESFQVDSGHADFNEIKSLFLDQYQKMLVENTQLFSGMEKVLDYLEQKNIPWGVVTNKQARLAEPILAHFGLAARCCCIVSGDTLPQIKPHPAPLLYACQLANTHPERSVYVGDTLVDMQAARAAGLFSIAAAYGYGHSGSLPPEWQAGAVITHPMDLIAAFTRMAGQI